MNQTGKNARLRNY